MNLGDRIIDIAKAVKVPASSIIEIIHNIAYKDRLDMEDVKKLQEMGIPIVMQLYNCQWEHSVDEVINDIKNGNVGYEDIVALIEKMTSCGIFYNKRRNCFFGRVWYYLRNIV